MEGYEEVFVDGLYRIQRNGDYYYAVLLRKYDDNKVLPIFIGAPEAMAIQMALSNIKFRRPLTHDLLVSILDSLGVSVSRITIDAIIGGIYTATLVLKDESTDKEKWYIDARPSDSIIIALKTESPIYVSTKLEKHFIPKEMFFEDFEEE